MTFAERRVDQGAKQPAPLKLDKDQEFERRILAKVSWRLMPILILGLFISYVDRANLGVLFSPMAKDLGLSATSFGLAAGLFYIGYLIFEIPSNMAMARFGAKIWISRIMISWGLVTVLLAFAHTETHLYVLRILLGLAEAGFFPGILLYLTFWYPRHALGKSYSLLEIGIPISLALASALTSSLLLLDGALGFAGWRWVFALQGLPAMALGFYILWVLPSSPQTANWLSEEEKKFLLARTTYDASHASGGLRPLGQVFANAAAWLLAALYFSMVIGFWSVTYFLPHIVKERFHVDTIQAGFISALPWLGAAIAIYIIGRTSTATGDRKWHMLFCLAASGAGLWLSAATDSPVLALIGLTFGAAGMQAAVPLFWAMPSAVFPAAIGAIAIAMINSIGNLSGLAGPWLLGFLNDLTGNSRMGLYAMAGFFFVSAILAFVLNSYLAPRQGESASGHVQQVKVPDFA